jgi:hypothetical protein
MTIESAAVAKAAKIQAVAADELSPERDPFFQAEYRRGDPPPPRMNTSISDEMARLNRNPEEMKAAIKAMVEHPMKGLNVTPTYDDKGNPVSVAFEIPGTEHYLGHQRRIDILNATDERNAQLLASQMRGGPAPMTWNQLHTTANILKSYTGNEAALSRMQDNVTFELRALNPKSYGPGLMFTDGKPDAYMVYGLGSPSYFHADGRITGDDLGHKPKV